MKAKTLYGLPFAVAVLIFAWLSYGGQSYQSVSYDSVPVDYVSGGGVCVGDLDLADYDIKNPDVIYTEAEASDVASTDMIIKGGGAYSQAAVNTTGGPLHLSGGIGTKKITCVQATASTTTLTFEVDGTSTTITEGTEWDCLVDDNTCCAALETYLDANIAGFTATAVANVVWLNPTYTTRNIELTSADGGGTKFAVVNGANGQITLPWGSATVPSVTFEGQTDYGFYSSSSAIRIATAGAAAYVFGNASATFYKDLIGQDIRAGAAKELGFNTRTIMTAPADGDLIIGNTAGTQGIKLNTATTDGTLYLTDEAAAALTLNVAQIVQTPAGTQTVAAGDTITSGTKHNPVAGSGGAVVMTSTPTIAAGSPGQEVCVIGTSDTNTVELQDETTIAGSTLEMSGDVDFVLGIHDTICFVYYNSHWIETTRSDNDND